MPYRQSWYVLVWVAPNPLLIFSGSIPWILLLPSLPRGGKGIWSLEWDWTLVVPWDELLSLWPMFIMTCNWACSYRLLLFSEHRVKLAQLLVHDDAALTQFCVDHNISDDVLVERSSQNDDDDWVKGEGNLIPIRTWFIHQAGLRFPLSQLLKEVMASCRLTFM